MAKLSLSDLTNITGNETSAINTINANHALIETALENTLSRDGTSPNSMSSDIDLNGNDLLNVGDIFVSGESYVSDQLSGLGYVDFTEINTPSAPATANRARMYAVDSGGTTKVEVKDSSANVHDLTHFTQSGTGAVLRTQQTKLREHIFVEDFGAVGDGSTNDSTAIQSAITYLEDNGGGYLHFQAKNYRVTSNPGVRVKKSGVHLVGVPGGYTFSGSNVGTRITYAGAASGTVVQFAPDSALSPYVMTSCSMKGFSLNGSSLASNALIVGSVYESVFEQIDCDGFTSNGVYTGTTWTTGGLLCYRNTFRKITTNASGGQNGFFLDGGQGLSGGYNTSFCSFYDCHSTAENGTAFFLRKADDCVFFNIGVSKIASGVGNAFRFFGSDTTDYYAATGNTVYGLNSGLGIFVDVGTNFQARGNKVFINSVDNQMVINDAARLLFVEDIGSYDATKIPYAINPTTTLHREDAVTNAASEVLRLRHHTTGTPATGIGARMAFEVETAAGNYEDAAYIEAVATSVTSTTEDFDLRFMAMRQGAAPSELGRWNSHGGLRATKPGAGGLGGIGYGTGAGGTVTQITSKATSVTLNTLAGQITMNNASLAAGAVVQFQLVNSAYSSTTDVLYAHHASAGTNGAYRVDTMSGGAGVAVISVTNITGGALAEAIVINFVIFKGSSA